MKLNIISLCTLALASLPAYAVDFDSRAVVAAHNKWRAAAGGEQHLQSVARWSCARTLGSKLGGNISCRKYRGAQALLNGESNRVSYA